MVKTRRRGGIESNSGNNKEDEVELGDLLAEGVFVPGRELSIVSADGRSVLFSAVLTRDGWLEDPHGDARYPDVASWVHTLLQSHDVRTRDARKELRALVRAARRSCGSGYGDEEKEDEDAAEEQCLWQCVHAGADGTLAEVRAAFCEWRRERAAKRPCSEHRDTGDSFLPCTQVLSPQHEDVAGAETQEAVASTLDPRTLLFPGDGSTVVEGSAAPALYAEERSLDAPVPDAVNAPVPGADVPDEAPTLDLDGLTQLSVPEPTQLVAAVPPHVDQVKKEEEQEQEEERQQEHKEEEQQEDEHPSPTVVASCLPQELLLHLAMAVKKLGGTTRSTFDAQTVTHVVVPAEEEDSGGGGAPVTSVRTSKLAQGVLTGKWVVAFQWVLDSFAAGRWLAEARYAVCTAHDTPSPVLAARRALAAGRAPLLRGVQLVVTAGVPPRLAAALADIAAAGGATVTTRAPPPPTTAAELLARSPVLVLAPRSTTPPAAAERLYLATGRRPVACEYVLDCVCAYALLPTAPYELELPRDSDNASFLSDDVEPSLQL